jgi:hypothetical protein
VEDNNQQSYDKHETAKHKSIERRIWLCLDY